MTIESITAMKKAIEKARQVCFFGIGTLLAECYGQLVQALGREPDLLCDNAADKWGREYFGKRCVSPDELSGQRDGTLVIITVRQFEGISEQLRGMGIGDILSARFDSGYHTLQTISRIDADQPSVPDDPVSNRTDLRGRWTLVTGASRGIGRQIALALAQLGSHIIAHSRSVSHIEGLIEACSAYDVQIVPLAAELSRPDEVEAMLERLERSVPQVDIVFNNAAIHRPGPWPEDIWTTDNALYRDCFMVNAIAPTLICQKLIPAMIRRGFGRLVTIHTNLSGVPHELPYVCSKGAMDTYVREMAPCVEGTGVMMTLVDPGWVKTDAGGPTAPHQVESVVPGVLLGAVLDCSFNGCRFSAQDYAGMKLETAMQRARSRRRLFPGTWV